MTKREDIKGSVSFLVNPKLLLTPRYVGDSTGTNRQLL